MLRSRIRCSSSYRSAAVHAGWDKPVKGTIEPREGAQLHAFAIVGYDDEAFWVQNSWGRRWGRSGLARWLYKDWAANIQDAWVLQLGIPAPSAFGLGVQRDRTTKASDLSGGKRAAPPRQDIAGHFVHVENGSFSSTQPYFTTRKDVEDTAALLGNSKPGKYNSLLLYAHGGLNTPEAAAIRTSAMTDVFMANGIYPYSVFYDTGLLTMLCDIITGHGAAITQRSGGLLDLTDELIEKAVGGIGKKLWNEMKADASLPFEPARDGETALRLFVQHLKDNDLPIHLVGHSTGAILVGRLLAALDRIVPAGMTIDSAPDGARLFARLLPPAIQAAPRLRRHRAGQAEQADAVLPR